MTRTETRERPKRPGSEEASGSSVSSQERRTMLEDLDEARRAALDGLEDVVVPKLREYLADPDLSERDRALFEKSLREIGRTLKRAGRTGRAGRRKAT